MLQIEMEMGASVSASATVFTERPEDWPSRLSGRRSAKKQGGWSLLALSIQLA